MKLAFCTTCKGRTQHLRQTLAQNIKDNPGDNVAFVLLDYNSDDGLCNFIKSGFAAELESGKLVYYRNNDAARFRMAHAKNQAHRAALREGADVLVNLDADNITGIGFAEYLLRAFERTKFDPQEIFFWSRMMKQTVMPRGISGRIAVTRNAFLVSGGYDEQYENHSPDDKDFNLRMRRLGFCAQEIDERYLLGVSHNDKLRFKEYPEVRDAPVIAVSQIARVVNNGNVGCGTVFRNFDTTPIEIKPIPTRLFGIGMHKTATRSLHAALKVLGFKSGHWENAHWAKAVWMEMTQLGKSPVLERFYAASDTPIPQLYQALDKAYPNSKFILTVRDEKHWLESVKRHFDIRFNPYAKDWNDDPFTHRMHRQIYGKKKFNEASFVSVYRRHNAEVVDYFKDRQGDLLVMNMSKKAGWNELAAFLDVPVPCVAYPTAGATDEIKEELMANEINYSQ